MRWLSGLVVAACVLWGGYWFLGARALENAAAGFLSGAAANGVHARWTGLSVAGFPNRFDLTATGVAVEDASGLAGWSAPFFQLFALSYRPNHVIAVWPERQTLTLAGLPVEVASERMRASLVVAPGAALALDRTTFVAERLHLSADLPDAGSWETALAGARAALHALPGDGVRYHLGLVAEGVRPDPGVRARLDPAGRHPPEIAFLGLDAELALDAPIDRQALNGRPPRLERIVLREARGVWGGMELHATGTLDIGRDGIPQGTLAIRARDWPALLDLAVAGGAVPPRLAPTYARVLEALAAEGGGGEWLEVPLVLAGGRMRLGPVPLGNAPRL